MHILADSLICWFQIRSFEGYVGVELRFMNIGFAAYVCAFNMVLRSAEGLDVLQYSYLKPVIGAKAKGASS